MSRIRATWAFVLIALLALALCGCSSGSQLMRAVGTRDVGSVKALLKGGADPNFKEERMGMTPLIMSAIVQSPEISQLLIDNGAEVNGTDQLGKTALHTAAMTGDCAMTKVLVLNGAEVDAADTFGATPLMEAVGSGADIVKCFIDQGADVNRPAKGGLTPLMRSVWRGGPEIVELLLDAGADTSLQTDCGDTAEDIVADMISAGINDNHPDELQRLLEDRRSPKTRATLPITKRPDVCNCFQ